MIKFFYILRKELRELITIQMVLPFAITILIFFVMGRTIRSEVSRSVLTGSVGLVDRDRSAHSRMIKEILVQRGFAVEEFEGASIDSIVATAGRGRSRLLLVIPTGFEERIVGKAGAEIESYSFIKSLSVTESMQRIRVQSVVNMLNRDISNGYIRDFDSKLDPDRVRQPVRSADFVVLRGRLARGSAEVVISFIAAQSVMIPVILLMLIIFTGTMVAASIGQEKENKTLETLLTVPVSRISIVSGKMLAAALLALLFVGFYIAGFSDFMSSFGAEGLGRPDAGPVVNRLGELGLLLNSGGYLMMALSIFLSIITALSAATMLALFARDTKSAQAALAPLFVLVLLPYFLSILLDPQSVSWPLRFFVYLIPFSHTFLAYKSLILGRVSAVWLGIIYQAVCSGVLIYLSARIFTSDRILTMRLSLKRS